MTTRSHTPFNDLRSAQVIAEIGQAHDGSLGTAHAYIDAVAAAGADAIKFQTHIAEAESTPGEPWRVAFSRQDASRYDYWRRMEFTEPQWLGLREHAAEAGLLFLSSPFSIEAVDLLRRIDVDMWKVASGEVRNERLLRYITQDNKPVVLSSGMSPWSEIDAAVDVVRSSDADLAVLQCTTAYPCPANRWGLNLIAEIGERYRCAAGFSDHSGAIHAGLAAVSLGAKVIEVHVTFSKQSFGPDVPASLTLDELSSLVDGVRNISEATNNPLNKDAVADDMGELRGLFTRSIAVLRDTPAGTVLTEQELGLRKPGTGIPETELDHYLGRTSARALTKGDLLGEGDVS